MTNEIEADPRVARMLAELAKSPKLFVHHPRGGKARSCKQKDPAFLNDEIPIKKPAGELKISFPEGGLNMTAAAVFMSILCEASNHNRTQGKSISLAKENCYIFDIAEEKVFERIGIMDCSINRDALDEHLSDLRKVEIKWKERGGMYRGGGLIDNYSSFIDDDGKVQIKITLGWLPSLAVKDSKVFNAAQINTRIHQQLEEGAKKLHLFLCGNIFATSVKKKPEKYFIHTLRQHIYPDEQLSDSASEKELQQIRNVITKRNNAIVRYLEEIRAFGEFEIEISNPKTRDPKKKFAMIKRLH